MSKVKYARTAYNKKIFIWLINSPYWIYKSVKKNSYRWILAFLFLAIMVIAYFIAHNQAKGSLAQQFWISASSGALIIIATVLIVDTLYAHHTKKRLIPSIRAAVVSTRANLLVIAVTIDKLFTPSYREPNVTISEIVLEWEDAVTYRLKKRLERIDKLMENNITAKTHKELRGLLDVIARSADAIDGTLSLRSYALVATSRHTLIEITSKLKNIPLTITPLPAPSSVLSTLLAAPTISEPPIKRNEAHAVLQIVKTLHECSELVNNLEADEL